MTSSSDRPRRPARPVGWPEGELAVPLTPATRDLAGWIATLTPDVQLSPSGHCLLIRATEAAGMCWGQRLYQTVVDNWPAEWQARGDGDALPALSLAARLHAVYLNP